MADHGALFAITGLLVFVIALHGIFHRPDLLGKIIATNVAASGVFAFLIGSAPGGVAEGGGPDPVPQALVLTGIVISVALTAYALSLLHRILDETGEATLPEDAGADADDHGER